MLPEYPKFKEISIKDKAVFSDYCAKFQPYSDFNILSLLAWDTLGVNKYSFLNGNLVLRIKDYLGDSFLYSMLGTEKVSESLITLLKEATELAFVPETTILNITNKNLFNITPDRDNDDYVIDTCEFANLEGHRYKSLRREVKKFLNVYPTYELRVLALENTNTFNEIRTLTEKWGRDKIFDAEKQQEELNMLNSYVSKHSKFNCINLGLYVKEKLVAYVFDELVQPTITLSHFGVADKSYTQSATMLEYLTAKYLFEHNILFENIEQDAGCRGCANQN